MFASALCFSSSRNRERLGPMPEKLKIFTIFGDGGRHAGGFTRGTRYEMNFSEFYFDDMVKIDGGRPEILRTPLEWTMQRAAEHDAVKCDSSDAFLLGYAMRDRGGQRPPFIVVESDLFDRARRFCAAVQPENGDRLFYEILLNPRNVFLYISEAYRRFYLDMGIPPDRLYYFPMCVESVGFSFPAIRERVKRAWKATQAAADSDFAGKILAVGSNERDYETLVAAVEGLPVEARIVCNLKMYKQTKAKNVIWHDSLPEDEYVDALRAAAMVVIPLRRAEKNFGQMSAVLPMALGKPVIATRTESIRDLIVDGETGLFVEPGDPASLRRAISRVMDDPELAARLGVAAKRREKELSAIAAKTITSVLDFVSAAKREGNSK